MSKVSEKLVTLYNNRTLPPFLILKGDRALLESEITEFLINIIMKEEGNSQTEAKRKLELGHQDILQLTPAPNKNYSVKDDLPEFFSFIQFSPYKISRRFIIFNDSEKLRNDGYNKLLKSLEDTPPNITVIFLAPKEFIFLATIESRAIIIREIKECGLDDKEIPARGPIDHIIESELPTNIKELLQEIIETGRGIHKLEATLKKHGDLALSVAKVLTEIEADRDSDYMRKERFLEAINRFKESQTYNSSPFARTVILIKDLLVDSNPKISEYS